MNKIVILGGYGAVGRNAAAAVVRWFPVTEVVVCGRNPATARPVPGASMIKVDLTDEADLARAVEGADAVLMCAELDNARIARACLERGIHYLDVSATPGLLASIEELDGVAREHGATAVLSVGLAPGVTNLLAKWCAERADAKEVRIGVLLGTGEEHGPASVRWTLDGLGELGGSWPMTFPAPVGRRMVHRFPFSDQYTLRRTLGREGVETGMCLDSRLTTTLLTAVRWPGLAWLLRRPAVRRLMEAALTKIHLGGDAFAATAQAGPVRATFSGNLQSRATGLAAALLLGRLSGFPPGVSHIDELVDPARFLTELAAEGFTLTLEA